MQTFFIKYIKNFQLDVLQISSKNEKNLYSIYFILMQIFFLIPT